MAAARALATHGDVLLPLCDGGDGFLECLANSLGGRIEELPAPDPHGRIKPVSILKLPDGTVAVESAKVIGLAGLEKTNPMKTSSAGLGHLLAILQSAPRLLIGLGGTATVDGGMGWPEIKLPPTKVFCDVTTDLCDAVRLFAPQKGARPKDLPRLQERLMALGLPRGEHTGAAGGLGAKLKSMGAELVGGAPAMMDLLGFDDACLQCTAVLTGEGRLDASTLEGKLPMAVALRARLLGRAAIGCFGCRGTGWEEASLLFDEVSFIEDQKNWIFGNRLFPKTQNYL